MRARVARWSRRLRRPFSAAGATSTARLVSALVLVSSLVFSAAGHAQPSAAETAEASQTDHELVRQAREIVANAAYQRELPGLDRATTENTPPATRTRAPSWRLPLPAEASSVFSGLAWVLLGAAVLGACVGLGLLFHASYRRHSARLDALEASTPDAALPAILAQDRDPRDLDALVAAGAWGPACHRLLRKALERVRDQSAAEPTHEPEHRSGRPRWPASLTSREILARTAADGARHPLAQLVAAVERSRFAGLPLAAEDYQRCAEAYAQIERGAR